MDEKIHVVIGSDKNYAPYYGVMLTSLFENNKGSQFVIYLLTNSSWTEKDTCKFQKLCNRYNSDFVVFMVDEHLFADFPVLEWNHISILTYYRLCAPILLPQSVEKVLYLDGDIIVDGSISDLWNIDLEEYAFAGTVDCNCGEETQYTRLNYDKKYGYFNAGVTLYNLKYWRDCNVTEKAIDFINNHRESIVWYDQDVVNALLHDMRYQLPVKYNYQTFFFLRNFWETLPQCYKEDVIRDATNPVIIHYNGHQKPWSLSYYGYPFSKKWFYYKIRSPWALYHQQLNIYSLLAFITKFFFFRDKLLRKRNSEMIDFAHNLQ